MYDAGGTMERVNTVMGCGEGGEERVNKDKKWIHIWGEGPMIQAEEGKKREVYNNIFL